MVCWLKVVAFAVEEDMMLADLSGKVAVVTGGAGGLGTGICTVLAECGALVAVADVNLDAAASLADRLEGGGGSQARAFRFDMTDWASISRLASDVAETFGSIDILVNNAGIHGAPGFEEATEPFREADWDATFKVNVKGTALVTEAVLTYMIRQQSGKIVNISSQAGRGELPVGGGVLAAPSGGAYGASKAAVIYLTQTYAVRLGPHNINVNCVCPGSVFTPLWAAYAVWAAKNHPDFAGLTPEQVYDKAMKLRTPLGRGQNPTDIGKAVAFFASEDARNITGQALNVNGGQRMN